MISEETQLQIHSCLWDLTCSLLRAYPVRHGKVQGSWIGETLHLLAGTWLFRQTSKYPAVKSSIDSSCSRKMNEVTLVLSKLVTHQAHTSTAAHSPWILPSRSKVAKDLPETGRHREEKQVLGDRLGEQAPHTALRIPWTFWNSCSHSNSPKFKILYLY